MVNEKMAWTELWIILFKMDKNPICRTELRPLTFANWTP